MTYIEARNAGYKLGDRMWQTGYISRKTNIDNQPVLTAEGNRKGQLYVLIPHDRATRYCIRQYLTK